VKIGSSNGTAGQAGGPPGDRTPNPRIKRSHVGAARSALRSSGCCRHCTYWPHCAIASRFRSHRDCQSIVHNGRIVVLRLGPGHLRGPHGAPMPAGIGIDRIATIARGLGMMPGCPPVLVQLVQGQVAQPGVLSPRGCGPRLSRGGGGVARVPTGSPLTTSRRRRLRRRPSCRRAGHGNRSGPGRWSWSRPCCPRTGARPGEPGAVGE